MRPTLFISDLHLAAERPHLVAAFARFCSGPAQAAREVYILGDLFDAWLGDDQLREPLARDVAAALRSLVDHGVRVALTRGNRDFLLGARFARASGATLLPEQVVVDVQGTPTLVLHGDELCTADHQYQRYRAVTRNRALQAVALALPYAARRAIARALRRQSRAALERKDDTITDVTPEAVADAFRHHGVTRMVHGHTHRPAQHVTRVDGRDCERIVLADWYERGSYIECTSDRITPHAIGA